MLFSRWQALDVLRSLDMISSVYPEAMTLPVSVEYTMPDAALDVVLSENDEDGCFVAIVGRGSVDPSDALVVRHMDGFSEWRIICPVCENAVTEESILSADFKICLPCARLCFGGRDHE